MAYKTKKSFSVISTIIVIMLITLVVGFVFKFTNGFNEDLKTFYITIDNKEILSTVSGYTMSPSTELKVDVKYVFGTYTEQDNSYSVVVKANTNSEKDFSFTVDGASHNFSNEKDLTKGFNIQYDETSFTIKPKGNINEILQAVYPDKEISDSSFYEYTDMYVLTVYSYNKQASVSVYFSIPSSAVRIELSEEEIVF